MINCLNRKVKILTPLVFVVLYIIYFSVHENVILLLLPLIIPILIVFLSRPKVMGYVFILANVQFLGFINPESFIRLPGVFKFNDLLFLTLIAIYMLDVLSKGFYFPKSKKIKIISILVLIFVGMVFLQFAITSLHFDLPFLSAVKVGRGYLYILIYFYFIRFHSDNKSMKHFLLFIAIVCVVQFIMMLFQIFGVELTSNTIIRKLESGSDNVTRVYLPAYFFSLLCFFTSTCLYLDNSIPKIKKTLIGIMLISFLSILLSYTRTYWLALIIGLIFIFVFSPKKVKINVIKYISFSLILLIPLFILNSDGFLIERFSSIFSEVGSDEGNFIYRFSENPQRLEAFFDNPIFGPGFVHSSYAASLFDFAIDEDGLSELQIERALLLQTNDSGLITLLVSFGFCGLVWVFSKLYFLLKIYKENRTRKSTTIPKYQQSIQLGVLAFILSVWLTCTTTYGFTYPDGIVALAIALFIFSFDNSGEINHTAL